MEDAREKLKYDLFYIKNASVGLDFWIVFQTVKIVLLGGARNEMRGTCGGYDRDLKAEQNRGPAPCR